jgi:hypothetical protein
MLLGRPAAGPFHCAGEFMSSLRIAVIAGDGIGKEVPYGVRVNAIGPGVVETPLTAPIRANPEWYNRHDSVRRRRVDRGRWSLYAAWHVIREIAKNAEKRLSAICSPRFFLRGVIHSYRSACVGAIFAARRAGT